jgi:hypothetical protein
LVEIVAEIKTNDLYPARQLVQRLVECRGVYDQVGEERGEVIEWLIKILIGVDQ